MQWVCGLLLCLFMCGQAQSWTLRESFKVYYQNETMGRLMKSHKSQISVNITKSTRCATRGFTEFMRCQCCAGKHVILNKENIDTAAKYCTTQKESKDEANCTNRTAFDEALEKVYSSNESMNR